MIGQLEFGEEDHTAALTQVWSLCLNLLKTKVPLVTFESFLRPIQPLSYQDNTVTFGVVSAYARDWLQKNTINAIRSALEFHLDSSGLQILFVVTGKEASRPVDHKPKPTQQTLPLESEETFEQTVAETRAPAKTRQPTTPSTPSSTQRTTKKSEPKPTLEENPAIPSLALNERYTFDTFLVGCSNRLAHAGAMQVASRPGEVYNPLFLYGGPGLGKTHLLQGIAHSLREKHPEARVAYISGEFFAQHYISALREHITEVFRRQYRLVDIWLVDDIQFIAGKEHTKEEFFHTFNTLYQGGKQIVIASDRSPRELNTMDERLRSRFQSGLIADIGAPDLETRIAILQRCRQRESANISDEVINYIASAIQSNIRALEGALTKLIAYSSIMKTPVRPELAQEVLSEYFIEKAVPLRRITVDEVVAKVAQEFGATPEAIRGPSRNKEISLARQIAICLCREILQEMNTTTIGAAFGGRDHATVVYACQKMRSLREIDPEINDLILRLQRSLLS